MLKKARADGHSFDHVRKRAVCMDQRVKRGVREVPAEDGQALLPATITGQPVVNQSKPGSRKRSGGSGRSPVVPIVTALKWGYGFSCRGVIWHVATAPLYWLS